MDSIWIATKEGEVYPVAFTSLKSACDEFGVSYQSALRYNKRTWSKPFKISLMEFPLQKIKRRGNKKQNVHEYNDEY